MHIHMLGSEVSGPPIAKDGGTHVHEIRGSETDPSLDNLATHTHRFQNVITSYPTDKKDIVAVEKDPGVYEVTMKTGNSKITRDLSYKEVMEEYKKMGLFSDQEMDVANQFQMLP